MGITLAAYMLLSRLLQAASSIIILSTNGFLIHYISTKRLGLTARMIAIQNMAAVVLFYTLLSIFILHVCHRSSRTNYLIGSIIWDLIFIGVCIGLMSVYSIAGVPSNCGGLTRQNWIQGHDAPNNFHQGFTTVRFGEGLYGSYGELDIYCGLPKTGFGFVVLLLFTYTLNILLSTLHILSFHYTHKSHVAAMIEAAEQKGKGSFSDLVSLITTVTTNSQHLQIPSSSPSPSFHSPMRQQPHDERRTDSPAPSFHSSPVSYPHSPTSSHSSSSPNSRHPQLQTSFPSSSSAIELSDIYSAGEMDMSDALVSDGSRGNPNGSRDDLPPYMPDLEANRQGAGNYGKDQDFPGLR